LGLTLVKRLVEMHGGRVEAKSRGVGHGSEFVVRLPAARPVAPIEPPARAGSARTARILVVDDNQDAARTLAAVLRLEGHDARAVFDGPAALALGPSLQPDIALLDLAMPEMDGFELAEAIRREAWGQGTALVAVSGWGRMESETARLDAFDHRLTKPVDPPALLELVSTLAPVGDH
jgi:CheY-like chemotaxis protein